MCKTPFTALPTKKPRYLLAQTAGPEQRRGRIGVCQFLVLNPIVEKEVIASIQIPSTDDMKRNNAERSVCGQTSSPLVMIPRSNLASNTLAKFLKSFFEFSDV
jgi:hypothetical protein